ncbi:phosphatidylinositol 4:5-bisphosphate 5-phosphatase A-like isoform X2, partial [Leptotrombidium deliense]
YVKRGPIGLLGNKGATAVRLDFAGTSLCFVSAHFQAGDKKLQSRIKDYDVINGKLYFNNPKSKRISNHDLIFWFGDLNFRLDDLSAQDIVEILAKPPLQQSIDELLTKDQLRRSMKAGDVFSDYNDLRPTFKPTYKYTVGTNDYNLKRKPAFTDRVLYRKRKENLTVNQITYASNDDIKISDHKPITALFNIL